MIISDEQLKKLLLDLEVLPEEKINEALKYAHSQEQSLYQALLNKDLIADNELGNLIADYLKLPFVRLSQVSIKDDVLQLVPELVAKKQKVITFKQDKDGLHLAMANPRDLQIREFIAKKTGLPLIIYFATERDINHRLVLYSKNVQQTFSDILEKSIKQAAKVAPAEPEIVKIVDTIIQDAYKNRSSDIHIEPMEDESIIRFRIDGILHDVIKLPLELHPQIVTRIKVLSKLRTDERQAAQDGKIEYQTDDEKLDIRVSIVPITDGEQVVMRLLAERSRQFSLYDLGLAESDTKKLENIYSKPYGMILATGPTGSGKTTTLYAILKLLNKRDVNIMTIEDPVEYDIEGVNQIQVNAKTNLTFAAGLKSIVRQDPDIIFVGEIRDSETANIAINSAMTGHLVLSTLHTNDAATAIPRLYDMKVERFLIASTVNVIVAQRLLRKICQSCRISYEQKMSDLEKDFDKNILKQHFGEAKTLRFYRGKGCEICHQSGYVGRIGIFEVLVVDDEIRKAIIDQRDAVSIRKISVKNGMTTMMDDGLEKVKKGSTTIEEVLRVTKE